jgi:hypothetical protein
MKKAEVIRHKSVAITVVEYITDDGYRFDSGEEALKHEENEKTFKVRYKVISISFDEMYDCEAIFIETLNDECMDELERHYNYLEGDLSVGWNVIHIDESSDSRTCWVHNPMEMLKEKEEDVNKLKELLALK